MEEHIKERYSNLVFGVLLLSLASVLYIVRQSFVLFDYPWMFPDSFDWLVNGFRYGAGHSTYTISHRAMLLPLSVALASYINMVDWVPMFGTAFYLFGAVLCFFCLSRLTSRFVQWTTTLLYVVSPFILGQSAFVGADVAANALLLGTALFFIRYKVNLGRENLLYSGVLFALGLHAQYINVIFLPTFILAMFTNAQGKLSFEMWPRVLTDKAFYLTGICSVAVGFIFFLPRIYEFGVLYEEHVQHGSLVNFYRDGFSYYLVASLAAFSWPVLTAALVGSIRSFFASERKTRAIAQFLLCWIVVVGGFFACLYTWKDSRFLLYISTPIYFLAAYGIEATGKVRVPLAGVIVFFSHLVPTTDPFDFTFTVSPVRAGVISTEFEYKEANDPVAPYFEKHWQESANIKQSLASDDFDKLGNSKPLRHIFRVLKERGVESKQISVFIPLSPEDYYIVSNRNVLYFGDRVTYLASIAEAVTSLQSSNSVLITTQNLADEHSSELGLGGKSKLTAGNYVAIFESYNRRDH